MIVQLRHLLFSALCPACCNTKTMCSEILKLPVELKKVLVMNGIPTSNKPIAGNIPSYLSEFLKKIVIILNITCF